MKRENKKANVVLPKGLAWIILTGLVLLDASLDVIFAHGSGLQSPIWKPIANLLKITNPLFLTPIALLILYFAVKGGAWLTERVDKITFKVEELVLTTLVIVYGIFDFWLVLVYFFNFTLFKSHYYLIPILVIAGAAYILWAEKKLKNK